MAKGSSKKNELIIPTTTTTMASKVDNQVVVTVDKHGAHIIHPNTDSEIVQRLDANRQTRVREGMPVPLGATWDGLGVNFAIFSAHATKVELSLFNDDG